MQVIYTESDYKELQKEVCYIMNDLKQLTDTICSSQYWRDFTLQANATCSAQAMCDLLKNYLVQMNFITCNVAMSNGGEQSGLFNFDTDMDSNTVDSNIGDNMELHTTEEISEQLLEDSQPENDEEGNKQSTEESE